MIQYRFYSFISVYYSIYIYMYHINTDAQLCVPFPVHNLVILKVFRIYYHVLNNDNQDDSIGLLSEKCFN